MALFSFLYSEAIYCLLASKDAAASHQRLPLFTSRTAPYL